MKEFLKTNGYPKVKACLLVVVLLGTLAFSNAYAGSFNIGTVQYNGKNTHFTNKEKNDPYTGGEFTLTNGSPRRIIMTTFSRDLKTLYQSGLVVRENEGYKKNRYNSGKPSGAGTGIAISYGDYDGEVGLYYSTSGYINYY